MRGICTFSRLGRFGRFANGCFQVAATIGIARMNGFEFGFPYWKNYNGHDFEPELDIDCQKEFVNPLPLYNGPELPTHGVAFGWHPERIKLTHSADLHGHFQSEKYFAHAITEVRHYLTMVNEPPRDERVAVHWRAGDYGHQPSPQHPDGNPYHPRMELSYYTPAMAQFPGRRFLVFSDDIPAAKVMFGGRDDVDYSEGRNYFDDFRHMKRCAGFVIANSSYSLMAAILSDAPDKKVVAPTPWFGSAYGATLDTRDIYSPEWAVVNYETGSVEVKR